MSTLSLPDAPHDRWLEAAQTRRSRRSFDGEPLAADRLDAVSDSLGRLKVSAPVRVALARDRAEGLFKGIIGGYGRITGAASAIIMVGAADSHESQVAVGYLGEAAVLEATALDIGTCWVGGMFDGQAAKRHVNLGRSEKIYAVCPLATPLQQISGTERFVYGMRKPKARKPLAEIAADIDSAHWPAWARRGAEAARIAPSANNRQPWRFRFDEGSVTIAFDGPDTPIVAKRVDCGIAMLHAELGFRAAGVSGAWELLEHRSDVARFTLGSD